MANEAQTPDQPDEVTAEHPAGEAQQRRRPVVYLSMPESEPEAWG